MEKPEKERIQEEHVDYQASHKTQNDLKSAISLNYIKKSKNKDKKDFATVQLVFDRRTLSTLNKLYKNSLITPISYCLSTGKEANVYHSTSIDGIAEYAVKIYKTMMLSFKDREEYISGEFRFRRRGKQTRTNPHKLIKVWAEKEFRNLKRIRANKIYCPQPEWVKENILVMEFIGSEGQPAPMLKQAVEDGAEEEISLLYLKVVKLIRKLFVRCKLVHGDLSEFNMLFWKDQIVVIDVSQAMEHNHPMALEFLRRDIVNMNNFFKKNGVKVFKLKQIYQFSTDEKLDSAHKKSFIDMMISQAEERNDEYDEDESFFMNQNLFRNLNEVDLSLLDRIVFGNDKDQDLVKYLAEGHNADDDDEDEDEGSDIDEESDEKEDGEISETNTDTKDKNEEIKEISEKASKIQIHHDEKIDKPEQAEVKPVQNTDHQTIQAEPEDAPQLQPINQEAQKDKPEGEGIEGSSEEEEADSDEEAQSKGDPKNKPGDSKYRELNKQDRKKMVKEEKKEKRKNKIPKKVKKKMEKKKDK